MPDIRKSPLRYSFQKKQYLKRIEEEGKDLTDPDVQEHMDIFLSIEEHAVMREQTEEWRKDNLEYDLRTSQLIIDKCADRVYAQHLYACLCNNYFIKNEVWPLLKEQQWHCSWRHAGGIVADILEDGDYIDWYCSGTRHHAEELSEQEFNNLTVEEQQNYLEHKAYVPESTITDEIRSDLEAIGWLVFRDESTHI